MIGIYKIESPTGKVYIGQSWNIVKRKREHRNIHTVKNKLYDSIKKYGFDSHSFEILIQLNGNINQVILDWHEILFIKYYESLGINMLNLKEGGSHGKFSEETKDKHRGHKRNLGRIHSEETKQKISESHKGKIRTEEHSKNISVAKKGKENLKLKGIKHSDEHINKWKMSIKGYKHTKDAKTNMGNAHKGLIYKNRLLTDEQIKEIRSYSKPLEYGMTEKLATQFNVSKGTINNIRAGWRYTNVR